MNNSQYKNENQAQYCPHCKTVVFNFSTHVDACQRRLQKGQGVPPIQQQNILNNSRMQLNQQQISPNFNLQQQQQNNQRSLSNQYSLNANQIHQDNLQREPSNPVPAFSQPQPLKQDFHKEERKYNDSYSNNYRNFDYQNQNNNSQLRDNGNMSYFHPMAQRSQLQEEIKCPQCDTKLTLEMVPLHVETCSNREVACQFCNDSFPQCLINDHLDVCQAALNSQQQQSHLRSRIQESPEYINNQRQSSQQQYQPSQQRQQQYQGQRSQDNYGRNRNRDERQRQPNRQEQEMPFQRQGGNISSADIFSPFQFIIQRSSSQGNSDNSRSNQRAGFPPGLMLLLNALGPHGGQIQYLFQNGSLEGFDHSNNGGLSKDQMKEFPQHQFKKRPEMSQDQCNCTICMCEFEEGENVKILDCLHSYHSECIDEWLKKNSTCPVCKKDMKEFV